jgi:hypothetical protein
MPQLPQVAEQETRKFFAKGIPHWWTRNDRPPTKGLVKTESDDAHSRTLGFE